MKTVLLTGATGYIGQFAIRPLLEKNYVVHAVTSKILDVTPSENVFWHRADLLNFSETSKLIKEVRPTHLLHFAWYIEHGKVWSAVQNLDWLQASIHLAKEFAANGGKRLVVSGTCAEYDWTKSGIFSEDSAVTCPQSLYGASKYALNLVLENFARNLNLSYAWGRIFYLFGANEPVNRLVPSVITALLENNLAKTSHGNQIRDFSYVKDVAEAFVALLESEVFGSVNIASGKGVKISDVAKQIAQIMNKPELLRINSLPSSKNEPPEIIADVTRLHKEVGWKIDSRLETSLKETINWWENNYKTF